MLRNMSLTKSESKQATPPPVTSYNRQKLPRLKETKVELFHLMRRIKAMYSVSCVTFFDQLKFRPETHPIGEVNSEFRQSYAEQCYDVDAVMPSETTTPDET